MFWGNGPFPLWFVSCFPNPEDSGKARAAFVSDGQGIVQTRLPSGELPKAKCQAMLELAALDPVSGILRLSYQVQH